MKRSFEVFDHTADIGILARGDSLASLMAAAAEGMMSLICGESAIAKHVKKHIRLQEPDNEALLVKWLNELLFEFEVNRMLFSKFDLSIDRDNRLSAICSGEKYSPSRHHIQREIKAATYHNLEIVRNKEGYSAKIIFDI